MGDIRDSFNYFDADGEPVSPKLKKEYVRVRQMWRFQYIKDWKKKGRIYDTVLRTMDTFDVKARDEGLKRGGIVIEIHPDTN